MPKLGFVVSEFNRDITYQMELLGKEHAEFLGAKVISVVYVPGVFDMPFAAKKLLLQKDIDAVVTIGFVIQGDTAHDEIVAQHAARKLMDLSLEFDKPV
ncbi:MAG: 6,7-dimethyl-8-ribityllumazine synthase, partial [Methanotrichaceae archaeon]|nr:6,7-dimethyl-8-ribityllumazine synthase [Methanotrichaceae archaeon]